MITDMTNTPYAFEEALPPEVAAAKVALRLQVEKIAGAVEVLHC